MTAQKDLIEAADKVLEKLRNMSDDELVHALEGCENTFISELFEGRRKDNQIIVTDLRPMSSFPRDGEEVMAFDNHTGEFVKAWYGKDRMLGVSKIYVPEANSFYSEKDFLGWIPVLTYRPKDNNDN